MAPSKRRRRDDVVIAACDACKAARVRCVQPEGAIVCARCAARGIPCAFATARASTWVATARTSTWAVARSPAADGLTDHTMQADLQAIFIDQASLRLGTAPGPLAFATAAAAFEQSGRRLADLSDSMRSCVLVAIACGCRADLEMGVAPQELRISFAQQSSAHALDVVSRLDEAGDPTAIAALVHGFLVASRTSSGMPSC